MELKDIGTIVNKQLTELQDMETKGISQLSDKVYLAKLFVDAMEDYTKRVKTYYEGLRKDLCAMMLREDTLKVDKSMFTATIQTKSRWSPILEYKGDVMDYFKNTPGYDELWTITSTDLNKTLTEIASSDNIPPELDGKIKEYIEQHVRMSPKKQ